MVQIVKTDEIKINDRTLKVKELPDNVQALVTLYDEWRQQVEDARVGLLQKEMAVGALQDRIATEIRALEQASNDAHSDDNNPDGEDPGGADTDGE